MCAGQLPALAGATTVTVTVPVAELPWPSETLYVKESAPR